MTTRENQADFDEVPRAHGEALYRCAIHLTGDHSAAMDLVQDTYERALRRGLAGVPAENIRGWLIVIARNQFVDDYRARKRMLTVSDERAVQAAPAPDAKEDHPPAWAALGVEDVRRALGRLNPGLLTVYRLHAFEGLDYATIAQRMGIPISTVGTRLRRARLRLRRALLEECAACVPLNPGARRVGSRPRSARPLRRQPVLRLANS
jgi:RNA polymerase sigma-70 factor (ECF subfamily)